MKRVTTNDGFTLVEVVLALGIIGFAILAILGILPVGLNTGRSAQDETRAAQIAQTIIESIASQAPSQFTGVSLPLSSGNASLDLSQSTSTPAAPAAKLYADNDAQLSQANTAAATYAVNILTNNAPTGFDSGYANEVTVNVAWPAAAPTSAQTLRSFSRVITKY